MIKIVTLNHKIFRAAKREVPYEKKFYKNILIFFIVSFLSGCDFNFWNHKVLQCPVPGQEGKIQLGTLRGDKLFLRLGEWKPLPGRYLDRSWLSEFQTNNWKRVSIWDFKYETISVHYRPLKKGYLLSENQLLESGTYKCHVN